MRHAERWALAAVGTVSYQYSAGSMGRRWLVALSRCSGRRSRTDARLRHYSARGTSADWGAPDSAAELTGDAHER